MSVVVYYVCYNDKFKPEKFRMYSEVKPDTLLP